MGSAKIPQGGMKHIYKKHSKEMGYHIKSTRRQSDEEIYNQLKRAIYRLPDALNTQHYEYLNDSTKFMVFYQKFVYVIGLAQNEEELNFLITTFKPDTKNYVQDLINKNVIKPINEETAEE